MGKVTGFMEFDRVPQGQRPIGERIRDFQEFQLMLPTEERCRQGGRCMDCGVPFCQAGIRFEGRLLGCPLHNLIPEWNHMIYEGNRAHALSRLLKTAPFPEFTGRVCPAPCEAACSCAGHGGSVTIRDNERYIIEYAFANGLMAPRPPARRSDYHIGVVGSGPAGLAAAHWLNRRGHRVTVYERDSKPGGLLMYGIPGMKLEKWVVARRIALMKAEGITFRCDVNVGVDVTMEALLAGHDCVVLACGAQKPRPVDFHGSARGVYYALDYLKALARQQAGEIASAPDARGLDVVVIGNGSTASDCIASAVRQGCRSVTQLVRRPAGDYGPESDYAHEETAWLYGRDIRRFESRVTAVIPDRQGDLQAVEVRTAGETETLPARLLLIASGFSGTEDSAGALAAQASGRVITAGDMRLGAGLVVKALADGARAAAEAERRLMGYTGLGAACIHEKRWDFS